MKCRMERPTGSHVAEMICAREEGEGEARPKAQLDPNQPRVTTPPKAE